MKRLVKLSDGLNTECGCGLKGCLLTQLTRATVIDIADVIHYFLLQIVFMCHLVGLKALIYPDKSE